MNEKSKRLKRLILLLTKIPSVKSEGLYSTVKFGFDFDIIEKFENVETDMTFKNLEEASECISNIVGKNHKKNAQIKIMEYANKINVSVLSEITLRFHA
jgi:CRISPR/Cas system-associated protein Cas5 (RAMP superfamily)